MSMKICDIGVTTLSGINTPFTVELPRNSQIMDMDCRGMRTIFTVVFDTNDETTLEKRTFYAPPKCKRPILLAGDGWRLAYTLWRDGLATHLFEQVAAS